jgi:sulfate adenylyltransferase subunit 1 (EFTu-like GTPase family)
MAEFNSCASLIKDKSAIEELTALYVKSRDPFQDILDMQSKLQTVLAEKLPARNIRPADIQNKGQLVDWMDKNFDAIMDEFRELKTSIGGMSRGDKAASAVWKAWKANNEQMRAESIQDMSDEDRLEMSFEMIDIMHFVANMLVALRINSKDLYVLYMLKNLENARRYNSGY